MKNVEKKQNKGINLFSYFKPYSFLIVCTFLLLVLNIVLTTISTIYSADFLTLMTERNFREAVDILWIIVVLFILSTGFELLLSIIFQLLMTWISSAIKIDLASRCFELSSKTFADHNLGSLTLRILRDPNALVYCVIHIEREITALIQCVVIVVYISFLNLFIGLLSIAIILVSFIFIAARKRLRERDVKVLNNIIEKNESLIIESIKGERDVKSLYMESSIKEQFTVNYGILNKKQIKYNNTQHSLGYSRVFA